MTSDFDTIETKFQELNLHLDLYVGYTWNQSYTIYGVTTIKDQSIVALNEIEIGKYSKFITILTYFYSKKEINSI